MKIRVEISPTQFALAERLAEQTLDLFKNRPGHYTNNRNSHLRGKLGEIAATQTLVDLGMDCETLWADLTRLSDADIEVAGHFKADVKTWDARHWPDLGRCIAVAQIGKLKAKADLVIWCVSGSRLEPGMIVEIQGWNPISEVERAPRRLTGPPNGRKVDNYQLDIESIHEIQSLPTIGL